MDPALDRSQRLLEHLGDLMVFEPVEIQEEGITEDLGQLMNGGLDILHPEVAFHRTCDGGLVGIKKEFVGAAVKNSVLLGFAAVVIYKNIPHDGVKPGFDICAYIIFILIG